MRGMAFSPTEIRRAQPMVTRQMPLKNMKKIALSLIVSALSVSALAQAPAKTAPAPAAAAPAASAPAPVAAAPVKGDAAAGQTKAVAICSGCHGVPGIRTAYPEVYNVPRLGGQNAEYIVSALRSYRAGDRFNQTMKGLASALTEKDIVDIAAYYGQK